MSASTAARNVRDYGAKGDGVTDDGAAFAAAVAAVPSGGALYIPAGNYKLGRSLPLVGNMTVTGDGPSSRIFRPHSSGFNIFTIYSVSNVVVQDLRIDSDDVTDETSCGIQVSGATHVTLQRLTFNGLGYGMKIDGGKGQNFDVNVIASTVLEAYMPMYVSYTSDSHFANLRLEAYRTPATTMPHNVYMSAGNHNLLWEDITLTGGRSYSFQLWGADATKPSDRITVRNLTMSEVQQGIAVGNGFSNVVFDGITGSSSRFASGMGWIDLQRDTRGGNAGGHIFRNFDFSHGALISTHDSSGGHPGPVTLENGVGRHLDLYLPDGVNHNSVDNATLTNMTFTSSLTGPSTTTTTRSPTTTTTNPPTTTTTRRLTTTTTQPPTTTTQPPTNTTSPPRSTTTTTSPTAPTTVDAARVTFINPSDHSTVWSSVGVKVDVKSSMAIGRTRLYVDDRLLSTDYKAPYAFSWNAISATPGSTHTLTCTAYDKSGQRIGGASVTVKIAVASSSPKTASASLLQAAGDLQKLAVGPLYSGAVAGLTEASIVSGFDDGHFDAGETITRVQFAKMLSGTLGIADEETSWTPFNDLPDVRADLYPHKYIAALISVGAVQGTSQTDFSPWNPVTRTQVITFTMRALEALAPEVLAEPPAGFVAAIGDFDPSHDRAMRLAEYNGLLQGLDGYGAQWDPWVPATRGEVAQLLYTLIAMD